MTTVKIKSGDWEVEVSTSHGYSYAHDITNFLTASIDSAVKNYVEPKSAIKKSDLDIRDNQIELLKEDLEVVHMYLDDLLLPRKDDNGETPLHIAARGCNENMMKEFIDTRVYLTQDQRNEIQIGRAHV